MSDPKTAAKMEQINSELADIWLSEFGDEELLYIHQNKRMEYENMCVKAVNRLHRQRNCGKVASQYVDIEE